MKELKPLRRALAAMLDGDSFDPLAAGLETLVALVEKKAAELAELRKWTAVIAGENLARIHTLEMSDAREHGLWSIDGQPKGYRWHLADIGLDDDQRTRAAEMAVDETKTFDSQFTGGDTIAVRRMR